MNKYAKKESTVVLSNIQELINRKSSKKPRKTSNKQHTNIINEESLKV